ncbi:M23 family metallopeptidase [Salinicoccus halitifaciens]|uniref:lysostaphin n=1 Tax=Salinicoccus halitifaciens TaxID=1073415 RepID=A0ABV2EAV4_9STAP|nr:M23 family metallopeptidase [Salinicoccus halitifaciens]MCD2137607.1 M23 family metallopeptidase [Salinicoccus halitifaciens]
MKGRKKIKPDDFAAAFLNKRPKVIYSQFIDDLKGVITLDQFEKMVVTFNQDIGQFYLKHVAHLGMHTHYLWVDDKRKKALSVYFGEDEMIHMLTMKPFTVFKDYGKSVSEVSYTMPVKEEWLVFWGGDNEFINYHYVYGSQRYAYDLLQMKDGKTHKGDPLQNENYHAFDKEITAPAGGKVVKVVNHIRDNVPGEMNEKRPSGNHVIIQHAHKEYSMIAHLKKESITVEEGDIVQQGDTLGRCGNSGNSSEPHLHFQVMDKARAVRAKSFRIRFSDGSTPMQGDIAKPTPDPSRKKFTPDHLKPAASTDNRSIMEAVSDSVARWFRR